MSIPRTGCVTAVVLLLTACPVNAGVLYCHDFASLDKTSSAGLALSVGPAPGGKAGTALRLANATNASGATAAIAPGVSLPNGVSVVFRLYVDSYTGSFMAIYNYAPGEGVRLLSSGGLQGSCGESLPGTWQTKTWYTVALVLVDGGGVQFYAKPGATATLDSATDLVGNICGGSRPMDHTTIFNYGGDLYLADYTINEGLDLSITSCPAYDNDGCAGARIVTEGGYAGTTTTATNDGSASCGTSNSSPDVWFSYTASRSGNLRLNTCGSTYDTVISVHAGCPGTAANQIASACNDNCGGAPCGGPASCLTVPILKGSTYLIRLAGANGATGTYALNLAYENTAPYYFEDFETGLAGWAGGEPDYWSATGGLNGSAYRGGKRLGSAPYHDPTGPPASSDLMGNVQARFGNLIRFSYYLKDVGRSTASNKHFYVFSGGNIWALPLGNPTLADWTKVSFEINTQWSDGEAQAAGWFNTPWNGGSFSAVWQNVTDYNFLSCGGSGMVDTGLDNVWVGTIPALTPVNDNCANADSLPPGGAVVWTNFATKDGSASCGGTSTSPDLWYSYAAPASGELRIDTCGSLSNTVLSVQSACGTGEELVCSDDCSGSPCGGSSSCLAVNVTQGTTYLIRLSNAGGTAGNLVLNVRGVKSSLPYLHNFADLHDITLEDTAGGNYDIGVGAAPDGSRSALHIRQLNAAGGTAVTRLIPNVWLPDTGLVTYQYRLYAEDRGAEWGWNGPLYAYLGRADLGPGSDGTYIYQQRMKLGNNGATLFDPAQPNTWYTVAVVYDTLNHLGNVYAAAGDVVLTPADLKSSNVNWGFTGAPGSLSFFGGNGDGFYLADFSITAGDAITPAVANDFCATAHSVADGEYTGTTNGATNDGNADCSAGKSLDVWYSYTATCGQFLNVQLTSATFDAVISIHSSCPGTAANQLACGTAVSVPVQIGEKYLIRVAGMDATARGDFSLRVGCGASPSDNSCLQDFNSGVGGWVGGSNDGGRQRATGGLDNSPYHEGVRGGYYAYHEPYGDPDRSAFTANLAARFGHVIEYSYYVKDFSAGEPGAGPVDHAFGLTTPSGYTQWNLKLLPAYPTEWTKVSFTIDTRWTDAQAKNYGWQRVAGDASWTSLFVVDGVPGTDAGLRALFAASEGAYSGTRVTGVDCVRVQAGTLVQGPPNDNCGDAQVIANGQVSGTTVGASNDGDAGCGNSGLSPDVWYAYVASCSDHLLIRPLAATFSPVISVYAACPGNLGNQMVCDNGGIGSLISLPVQQGQTYVIRVAGSGGAVGTFTLDVTCGSPPPPSAHVFCHDFTAANHLSSDNTNLTYSIGPAPGGKTGNALKTSNPTNAYYGLAHVTPGVTLPADATVICRLYIDNLTGKFDGMYFYGSPGEGVVIRPDGTFGHSWGGSFNVPWNEKTWYTVAVVLSPGANLQVYLKEGADAALTTADLIGTVPSSTGRPWTFTGFYNNGGDLYVADYTVNENKNGVIDFTVCGQEPPSLCHIPFADVDGDGDVDQGDFGLFQVCYTGLIGPVAEGCECLDHNKNGAVDGFDFLAFEGCWSGPTVPADPACAH